MKKFVGGLFAVVLAVGASAFTAPNGVAADPVYNWNHYSGSTASPTITVVELTDADAQNFGCAGSGFDCLVKLDAQMNETNEKIERSQQ